MNIRPNALATERITNVAGESLRVVCPAKINLNLLVSPRRDDGFHPLDSLVTTVSLYDELIITPANNAKISLTTSGIPCGSNDENLARVAAEKFLAAFSPNAGVDILLTKNIPPGKGLGGGSSDAAGVLIALRQMLTPNLEIEDLVDIAADLGSDVPLFLQTSSCRMTGRGEIIEPISIRHLLALLILGDIHCPTGEIYHAFDENPTKIIKQLDKSILTKPPSTWRNTLKNDLAAPARATKPALGNLWDKISTETSIPVYLTGSGSCLFILCDDISELTDTFALLSDETKDITVAVHSNPW